MGTIIIGTITGLFIRSSIGESNLFYIPYAALIAESTTEYLK